MDALRTMFQHDEWATLTLIDHCAEVPPERLHETVPGTHGTILATLVHLVAANQRYLLGMTGQLADRLVREGEEPPLRDLRESFETQARRWQALVDRANELNVTLPARGPDEEVPHAENLVFLQAIHHGNDHRTQICTILGANGLPVPDLDGWAYWPTRSGGVHG